MNVRIKADPIPAGERDGWALYEPGKPKAHIGWVRVPLRFGLWIGRIAYRRRPR